jgi:alpha-D-ribose 1-methylphosphonate 5-triphosphate synthase subunit PhnH
VHCETYTQKAFKALMQAMSRPGTVHQLDLNESDGPLMPVLLTLLDQEVTFAVVGKGIEGDRIALATGSKETAVEEADFVLVSGGDSAGAVLRAKRGDIKYPDKGATILYLIPSVQGRGTRFHLEGPGILESMTFAPDGFGQGEARDVRAANAEFPIGVDCVFVDKAARMVAVPRSVRMEVA